MPKVLTAQQIEQFHEDGFLSPIDVISESEADDYLKRLEAAEANYPDALNPENRNNPHLVLTFLDELIHHPIILDVVEDLIGPDFGLYGSVLFAKEPQTQHFVSWHQDGTYMGLNPMDFVTPWLALSPSNLESGCMSMIPGSHKHDIRPHADTFSENNILTRGQEIQEIDESVAVDLILRPGQMSIHHGKIIHGSKANRGSRRRVGYAMQCFAPYGCRQELGENLWLPIRGNFMQSDFQELVRPKSDMDEMGMHNRKLANDNWADILYQGADQKRSY